MTPEEAVECLQDEECLESVAQEAIQEAETEEFGTVPERESAVYDAVYQEALDVMSEIVDEVTRAGGDVAKGGGSGTANLETYVSAEAAAAYDTLTFITEDGEITQDEYEDASDAIATLRAELETGIEPQGDGDETASVGDAIALHGYDPGLQMRVKVVQVIDPAQYPEFFGPSGGNRYVAVRLRMTNTGSAVYSDSPSNGAYLIDRRDQQYQATITEVIGCPDLGSPKIRPGDSRQGCVTFEVPTRTRLRAFQLTLESGFADETGEWTLR